MISVGKAIFAMAAFLTLGSVQAIQESATTSTDRARLRKILIRVQDQNQPSALMEIAKLPADTAIPVLSEFALNRTTNSENSRASIVALKEIRGLDGYFRRYISGLLHSSADQYLINQAFDVMALVANREAASAAAQFLFDESEPALTSPDVGDSPVRWKAANALTKMRLPGSPVSKPYYALSKDDLEKWREWAVEQKLVNNGGLKAAAVSPSPPSNKALVPAPLSPVPKISGSLKSIDNPNAPVWPWLVGIAALVIISLLNFKRRM